MAFIKTKLLLVFIPPTVYELPISCKSHHRRHILILQQFPYSAEQLSNTSEWKSDYKHSSSLVPQGATLRCDLINLWWPQWQCAHAGELCVSCPPRSHIPFSLWVLFQIHPKVHSNLLSQDLLWQDSNTRQTLKRPDITPMCNYMLWGLGLFSSLGSQSNICVFKQS